MGGMSNSAFTKCRHCSVHYVHRQSRGPTAAPLRAAATNGTTSSHYDVLGVPRHATLEQVKAAYRSKARLLHPDVNKQPNARELFMECKEAYEILSDPGKRSLYDATPSPSTVQRTWAPHREQPAWARSTDDQSREGATSTSWANQPRQSTAGFYHSATQQHDSRQRPPSRDASASSGGWQGWGQPDPPPSARDAQQSAASAWPSSAGAETRSEHGEADSGWSFRGLFSWDDGPSSQAPPAPRTSTRQQPSSSSGRSWAGSQGSPASPSQSGPSASQPAANKARPAQSTRSQDQHRGEASSSQATPSSSRSSQDSFSSWGSASWDDPWPSSPWPRVPPGASPAAPPAGTRQPSATAGKQATRPPAPGELASEGAWREEMQRQLKLWDGQLARRSQQCAAWLEDWDGQESAALEQVEQQLLHCFANLDSHQAQLRELASSDDDDWCDSAEDWSHSLEQWRVSMQRHLDGLVKKAGQRNSTINSHLDDWTGKMYATCSSLHRQVEEWGNSFDTEDAVTLQRWRQLSESWAADIESRMDRWFGLTGDWTVALNERVARARQRRRSLLDRIDERMLQWQAKVRKATLKSRRQAATVAVGAAPKAKLRRDRAAA